MNRGLRSARRVVDHRHGRVYGTPRPTPDDREVMLPAGPPLPWPPVLRPPAPPGPPPSIPLNPAHRLSVRRRAWTWNLLLAAWFVLMVMVGYVGAAVAGWGSLCCLTPMAVVLLMLAWIASSDVREFARTLRGQ